MSKTGAIEVPLEDSPLPEWRRLCHIYHAERLRSVCGTATRETWQGHTIDECEAGGHTICVVCGQLAEAGTSHDEAAATP